MTTWSERNGVALQAFCGVEPIREAIDLSGRNEWSRVYEVSSQAACLADHLRGLLKELVQAGLAVEMEGVANGRGGNPSAIDAEARFARAQAAAFLAVLEPEAPRP